MRKSRSLAIVILLLIPCQLGIRSLVFADEGDPMAIRRWPGGILSLETNWGLNLAVDTTSDSEQALARKPDHTVRSFQGVDHVLFRLPNKAKPTWVPASKVSRVDQNAVSAKSTNLGNDDENCLVLKTDGVKIVVVPFGALESQNQIAHSLLDGADLLILQIGGNDEVAESDLVALTDALRPKVLMLNPIGTGQLSDRAELTGDRIVRVDHNTLALSQTTDHSDETRIVTLADSPWTMPHDLEALFSAMEKASTDSQKVFERLSVEQMNFKPSNGTHTPRWNTEHMMGRQLLFFSQIYGALDDSIPLMDLNPAQMPPDYVFAHPGWDGGEEARQMQRVGEFSRRFAYLLDGVGLDEKPPGSNWQSLRALLLQMQRHYQEHTANTIKKFGLPDWPTE